MNNADELKDAANGNDTPAVLKDYPVRIALVGYSYGAARAISEADELANAISDLGMKPEIYLFLVDGYDPPGKALTRLPTSTMAGIVNILGSGGLGVEIGDPRVKNIKIMASHIDADEEALVNQATFNLTKVIVDLELKPFRVEGQGRGFQGDR